MDDTWSPVLSVFETPPETWISTMSSSPTSELLAITTSDSQLLIWNVNSGYMHKNLKYNNSTLLTTSPDLQWLAVITMRYSSDSQKHVQDALEVRELNSNDILWTRTLDNRQALAMKVSPDSRWLAVCYKDELHVFDRDGGTPRSWLWQFSLDREPSAIAPWRMEFSSDCALLLLLYYGHGYRVLVSNLGTGIQYKRFNSEREYDEMKGSINDAKFVPNTHRVLIWGRRTYIYLWDFLTGECNEWPSKCDYVDCLTYSHAESWMTIAIHKEVILLCRDQQTLPRKLEIPDNEGLKAIEVSYDDEKIAVCSTTTIWILDVRAILDAKPSSEEEKDKFRYILDDGVPIAYHDDVFSTIEIENPIEGAITTLDIRDSLRENANVIALSPEGRLLAYSDESSIHVRDLDRSHLRYSFEVHAEVKHIAISSEIGGDGQWIAVCVPSGVVVWDIGPGQFHSLVNFHPKSGRYPARAFFVGTRLAVLWCFRRGRRPDFRCETLVLYDIKTGQQLTQLNLPCSHPLSGIRRGNFSISPNGKWTVSYVFVCRRLLLSDVEAGVLYAVVDIDAKWFSFIDNSTLWTDQGVLSLDCVLDDLAVESRSGRTQIVDMDSQGTQELPLIIPTLDKYGRNASCEWITFDTNPLIWLPQQYRPNNVTDLGEMAIGHHHVTIESRRGTYSIVFTNDTGDHLRQAMDSLFI